MTRRCVICGDDGPRAREWVARYAIEVPDVEVCQHCAERVANAFNKVHAGEWLTWPNARKAPEYVKARIPHCVRRAVYERDRYRCVECDSHIDLTLDHIKPESKGGETTEANLRTLCRPCNSRKGARE